MLFFNKRKELEKRYYEWIKENGVKDCPFSVISFLVLYGLTNDEKILEFLKEDKYENSDCN